MLRMRLQAMTWAAHAKDAALVELEAKLQHALMVGAAAQARNKQLEEEARAAQVREEALRAEEARLQSRLERAEAAEERLAQEMGGVEAEALHQALDSGRLIASLKAQVQAQQAALEEATRQQVSAQICPPTSKVEERFNEERLALQQRLEASESARQQLASANTDLQATCQSLNKAVTELQGRAHNRNNEDSKQVVSLKLEDLGMRLKFWIPSSLVVGKHAAAAH